VRNTPVGGWWLGVGAERERSVDLLAEPTISNPSALRFEFTDNQ
jgi:hypothetical protein